MSEQLPAAGWYVNAEGQTQWWDGTAWGRLASEVESDAVESADSAESVEVAESDGAEPDGADSDGPETEGAGAASSEASHQPVAQEFSREFLEQQYGVGRAEGADEDADAEAEVDEASPVDGGGSSDSPLTDPVAEWASASYAPPTSQTSFTPAPAAPAQPTNSYAPPAPPQAPQASGQINGQYSVQYSQQFPAPAYLQQAPQTPKPPTHVTAWFALGAVALGLILTIIGSFSGLGWMIPLAVLAVIGGIVLSIIALLKSQKKGIPVTGLVLSATGIFWVPIIALIGVFVYFANDTSMLYSL